MVHICLINVIYSSLHVLASCETPYPKVLYLLQKHYSRILNDEGDGVSIKIENTLWVACRHVRGSESKGSIHIQTKNRGKRKKHISLKTYKKRQKIILKG